MMIKAIFLGILVGFLAATVFFFVVTPVLPQIFLGRLLDVDTIIMKNGLELHGKVVNETDETVFLEAKKGFFPVPRSTILRVEKGALLMYLRKAI